MRKVDKTFDENAAGYIISVTPKGRVAVKAMKTRTEEEEGISRILDKDGIGVFATEWCDTQIVVAFDASTEYDPKNPNSNDLVNVEIKGSGHRDPVMDMYIPPNNSKVYGKAHIVPYSDPFSPEQVKAMLTAANDFLRVFDAPKKSDKSNVAER